MAQYGDPNNSDLSRFQRYAPGTESSANGQASSRNPVDGSTANGNYSGQPRSSIGDSPAQASSTISQAEGSYDANWPQRPSSMVRKRNQWRQFQRLTPDFGPTDVPTEPPPAPSRPPWNASLPNFSATAKPVSPLLPSGVSRQPSGLGSRPSSSSRHADPGSSSYLNSSPAPPSSGQSMGAGLPPSLRFKSSSNSQGPSLSLHPHPHSTALPEPTSFPGGSTLGRAAVGTSANVTPLRHPAPSRSSSPRSQSGARAAAQTLGDSSGVANPPQTGGLRSRPPAKPRRRLAKPPLPLLYLIRLIILGVGVAAIAGTLLSVLSPSNLASSSGQQDKTTQGTTLPTAVGPLVNGTTASSVSAIALDQELTRLKAEVEQLATLTPGLTQTAFMVDLETGNYVDIAGGTVVSAASTIKVPILVAFLQQVDAGNIALNQGLVLQEEQVAGGSGAMQNDPIGTRYTTLAVVTQMIIASDNTATNMLVDALGGADALNQQFQAWGLEATVLRNPLPDLDGTNTTSAKDLTLLMALVDQGGLLMPRSRDRMFSIMQRTINRSLIPFGIADDSIMANKTGDINTVLGDVALVDAPNGKRYTLATLVERPDNDGRASELIRRTAETAHGEFSQPIAPVGGVDPNSSEEAVPTPAAPEEEIELPTVAPEEVNPDRQQIPQG